jgi:hypothetical protein
MSEWNPLHELIRAFFSSMSAIVVLAFSWFIGQRLSYEWAVRQKTREFQLSALQQFYVAYGEFFAVWKLWNRLDINDADRRDRKWELHKRAAAAEAIIEATLVKLSSELAMDDETVKNLGCFRQAFQQLRQSIRQNRTLPWHDSDDPAYVTFKTLAIRVSALLRANWLKNSVTPEKARNQLLAITSNQFEDNWVSHTKKS